eukprot:GGOE01002637.1.p1 GENE.GGOE01002637.1~~GGOE01002637.1.p1  ORF type:complete len:460 (+),score=84.62 GGOE01002637.1:119-1498(+)
MPCRLCRVMLSGAVAIILCLLLSLGLVSERAASLSLPSPLFAPTWALPTHHGPLMPGVPDAQGKAAEDLVQVLDHSTKETDCLPIFGNSPQSGKAEKLKEAGNQLYRMGKYAAALNRYSEAIRLQPAEATFYANRAAAQLMLGLLDECIVDCTAALQLQPDYTKALLRRGRCHTLQREWGPALRDLEAAFQLDDGAEQLAGLQEYWGHRCRWFEVGRPPVRDYFRVLGLTMKASDKDIKKAFHRAALRWHPDKRPPPACAEQRQFQDLVFREITEAHTVLLDAARRRQWEQQFAVYRVSQCEVRATRSAPPAPCHYASWRSPLPRASAPLKPAPMPRRPSAPSGPPPPPPPAAAPAAVAPRPAPAIPKSRPATAVPSTAATDCAARKRTGEEPNGPRPAQHAPTNVQPVVASVRCPGLSCGLSAHQPPTTSPHPPSTEAPPKLPTQRAVPVEIHNSQWF